LTLPKLYLQAGGFVALPQEPVVSGYPGLGQMLFALGIAAGRDDLAALASWLHAGVLLLATYALVRRALPAAGGDALHGDRAALREREQVPRAARHRAARPRAAGGRVARRRRARRRADRARGHAGGARPVRALDDEERARLGLAAVPAARAREHGRERARGG